VTGLAEGAFTEREDLGGRNPEHESRSGFVMKAAVTYFESPPPSHLLVHASARRSSILSSATRDGIAFHHHVHAVIPAVTAGHQDHVQVAAQIEGLLFIRTCLRMQCVVEPHGDERSNVRPAIGSVEIQKSSAVSSARRVAAHSVATASESLKRTSSVGRWFAHRKVLLDLEHRTSLPLSALRDTHASLLPVLLETRLDLTASADGAQPIAGQE
jgi:hypothetical protein